MEGVFRIMLYVTEREIALMVGMNMPVRYSFNLYFPSSVALYCNTVCCGVTLLRVSICVLYFRLFYNYTVYPNL